MDCTGLFLDEFDQLDMVIQITELCIIQHLLLYILSDFLELLVVFSTWFKLLEDVSQQSEGSTVECSLSQSFNEVRLARNVELGCFSRDYEAEEFGSSDIEVKLTTCMT